MQNQETHKVFGAYFDDAEGISEEGIVYTVIAGALIPQHLFNEIESNLEVIWDKYLPGVVKGEFHATDLEEATKWPYSILRDDEALRIQEDFIDLIGILDIPLVAVTINDKAIASNPLLGDAKKHLSSRDLATSLAIAICTRLLIFSKNGEELRLTVDDGLLNKQNRHTIEEAIKQLQSFGATAYMNITQEQHDLPSSKMNGFSSVNAELPEEASHKLAGLQLADHVARYVFKFAKNPDHPDPRYLQLLANGLMQVPWNSVFPGVSIHIRPPKGMPLSFITESGLETLKTTTSKFKTQLQNIFSIQRVCPKCSRKLYWGLPSINIQDMIDNGELDLVGSLIKQKNYCPRCKTLVFTLTDYTEEIQKNISNQ